MLIQKDHSRVHLEGKLNLASTIKTIASGLCVRTKGSSCGPWWIGICSILLDRAVIKHHLARRWQAHPAFPSSISSPETADSPHSYCTAEKLSGLTFWLLLFVSSVLSNSSSVETFSWTVTKKEKLLQKIQTKQTPRPSRLLLFNYCKFIFKLTCELKTWLLLLHAQLHESMAVTVYSS